MRKTIVFVLAFIILAGCVPVEQYKCTVNSTLIIGNPELIKNTQHTGYTYGPRLEITFGEDSYIKFTQFKSDTEIVAIEYEFITIDNRTQRTWYYPNSTGSIGNFIVILNYTNTWECKT